MKNRYQSRVFDPFCPALLVICGALVFLVTPGLQAKTEARQSDEAKGGQESPESRIPAAKQAAVESSGGSALPGGKAAVEAKDPPPDQKYKLEPIVLTNYGDITAGGATDGQSGVAEDSGLTKGVALDDVGDAVWTPTAEGLVRRYDRARDWISTLAGSARGYLDGPVERARFGVWSYNNSNLICYSADGKHVFVKDGDRWRYIDVEAGMVSTVGKMVREGGKGLLIIASDRGGDICAFCTNGDDPPDCKGYRKLKAAPYKTGWIPIDGLALDAEHMKFYWHARYGVNMLDLKTGEKTEITAGPKRKELAGPIKGTYMYCPTGMSISGTGRFLYVGGGDSPFSHRFDLEGDKSTMLGRNKKGADLMFRSDADHDYQFYVNGLYASYTWPSACVFTRDGACGVWPTAMGLFRVVALK